MKYLFDTSIWLWSLTTWERFNEKARAQLSKGQDELYLSAVSSWEIAIKTALGKMRLPESAGTYIPARMATEGVRPSQSPTPTPWRSLIFLCTMATLLIVF